MGFHWRLVTVDIDGTLTRGHGWDRLADAFHARRAYDESNRRFYAHEIGEDEHLTDLLNITTGHLVSEVDGLLEETPKLSGISDGIRILHERGARVALLTHNPTYVTGYYRRMFGFDDDEGVDAQKIVAGRIGAPVGVRADKRAGLRLLLERSGARPTETVHIGDGWSDAEVFPDVGGGIALNSALPEVRAAADLVLTTTDFRVVAESLDRLDPRPLRR